MSIGSSRVYYPGKTYGEWINGNYTVRLKSLGRLDEVEEITYYVEMFNKFKKIHWLVFANYNEALANYMYLTQEMLPVQLAQEAFRQAEPLSSVHEVQTVQAYMRAIKSIDWSVTQSKNQTGV